MQPLDPAEDRRIADEAGDMACETSFSHAKVNSDAHIYVLAVVNALRLGDDEVLLAVAWVTKEGRLAHIRHPFVLGTDVTFGKNNEKRPHNRTVGKNALNKSPLFVDGFLPSQQDYVFIWYFQDAIPTLLDPVALLKTAIMITDQCPRMCPAMQAALDRLGKFGLALRRLCKWHKVSVNMCHLTHVR